MSNRWWIVGGALVLLACIVGFGSYNSLVQRQESIRESWAQVETVLQRRYDLIPNLVNTVEGYATHERALFEEVTRLRSQWGQAKIVEDKVAAAQSLEGSLARLLLVVEQYPELKANQNFLKFQDQLEGTENRIAVERRRYNESIRSYNVAVRGFPSNLVAALSGFKPSTAYFESATEAQQAPKVEF